MLETLFKDNKYQGMIGSSTLMKGVFYKLMQASETDSFVLLLGETGVGKELAAKALHATSPRYDKSMVSINCSAISPEIFESELYGHEKGSFSGAWKDRVGKFRDADGGTLFLDEIGSMPIEQQPKLLRALENMEITPIGSDKVEKVDVRVISATNAQLYTMIGRGNFRSDLYYRISPLTIEIPPLRERPEDIGLLVNHFLSHFSEKYGKKVESFTRDEEKEYRECPWPGNVRELQNAMEELVVFGGDKIKKLQDLRYVANTIYVANQFNQTRKNGFSQSQFALPAVVPGQITSLESMEKDHILRILRQNDGNNNKTAKALGINVRTLYRKLQAYNKSAQNSNLTT